MYLHFGIFILVKIQNSVFKFYSDKKKKLSEVASTQNQSLKLVKPNM